MGKEQFDRPINYNIKPISMTAYRCEFNWGMQRYPYYYLKERLHETEKAYLL